MWLINDEGGGPTILMCLDNSKNKLQLFILSIILLITSITGVIHLELTNLMATKFIHLYDVTNIGIVNHDFDYDY